jgi:type IV pilus assembly protein PilM
MNQALARTLLHYFPTPRFLSMPSVGFEVTPEAVRFLEFKRGKLGLEIGRFGERRLPPSDDDEENFLGGERIKKIVTEIRNENKLELVTVALPEEKVYLFKTEVPRLKPTEIRESIELKLEENVPIPPKEAIFDYEIIPTTGENNPDRLNVSVSVVPRQVTTRYLEFFRSLNMTPVSFKVSAQAVADSVIKKGDVSPTIIMNFGDRKTGFYIVSNGIVHFTSTIAVGGNSLTEAIKKSFSISFAQAEKMKMEKGVMKDKKNTELFFSLVSTLSVLKDEVNKLSVYWDDHLERYTDKKQKVVKVVLCGRESVLHGLAEYLQTSLTVPVELANVWVNTISLNERIPPISRNDSLSYASVIGLTAKNFN